jgi:hypothetical protein
VPGLGAIGAGIRADMVAKKEGFQIIPYREYPVHVLHAGRMRIFTKH